ncbi:hypothetical protein SAY87_027887 [Trapa incisa]|uniref:Uncharacterized protein n=1 Tax=Trapa incisa TaxID=236973 RepID=A0AAN7KYS6_9MYRT|nr:hypothetical protein SAY87_027887 [Trapa incisa]
MGDDSSASYIHMVHHLIEECLLFSMSIEECMEALSKHANIPSIVTSTVWKELEKVNKEFFEAYNTQKKGSPEVHGRVASASFDDHGHQMETRQRIRRMLSDSSKK